MTLPRIVILTLASLIANATVARASGKRLDCYINDRRAIYWTLGELKRDGLYDAGGIHAQLVETAVIGVEPGFLGFTDRDQGRFPFKTDFVKKFDTVIYQMKRQGEIERIAQEYFKK